MKRTLSAFVVALLLAVMAVPAFAEKRVALVIGNGRYVAVQKLANPPNDAGDIAAKLESLGFSVTKLVDADLGAMEKARVDFARESVGASIRVFYYAGHGVQSEGVNWLLPVDASIREDYELKIKAFSAQAVLDGLKTAGPGVNLVILDACRDNPFKATSRSAGSSRGLAVMGTSGSLIVYATGPGSTAADGSGRNGVFTAALLSRLDSPGTSLQEIMTNVAADVVAATKGAQEPWKQDNLTKMVYFVTPEEARASFAERIAREEAVAKAEDARLAELRTLAAREVDSAKKATMEVEIRKQAALQQQKRDELAALKAEKDRQEAAARAQADMAAQLTRFQREAQARDAAMRDAAEARRRQLAAIQSSGSAGGIASAISAIEAARAAVSDLEAQYAASLKTVSAAVAGTFDARLGELSKWTMDPWENQREFEARLAAERNRLSAEKSSALASARDDSQGKMAEAVEPFHIAASQALASIPGIKTTWRGDAVSVSVGDFDRDAKTFPITITSEVSGMPFSTTFRYSVAGASTDELKANYLRFEAWQKASALFGELDVRYVAAGTVRVPMYVLVLDAWRVKAVDAQGDHHVHDEQPALPLAYFSGTADMNTPRVPVSSLIVLAPGARIAVDGAELGTGSAFLPDPVPGNHEIKVTLPDGAVFSVTKAIAKGLHVREVFSTVGSVSVRTSTDGDLYLDGKLVGKARFGTPLLLDGLAVGTHQVEIRYSDKKSENRDVLILYQKQHDLSFNWVYKTEAVWVEGGSFSTGTGSKTHTVTVSGFWMMNTEVTQADYLALMGTNPSYFKGYSLPVEGVSWYDAIAYANKLSQKDGLTPAYIINDTKVVWNMKADGWRLPTAAEWEYAALGGAKARGFPVTLGHDEKSSLDRVAWYSSNSGYTTHAVSTKEPNALGLYDMFGNVGEWCWNFDVDYDYGSASHTDPTGRTSGDLRMNLGSSWESHPTIAGNILKKGNIPSKKFHTVGFRLVRPPVR